MSNNDSAFPSSGVVFVDSHDPGIREIVATESRGMTLRDYMAAAALPTALEVERDRRRQLIGPGDFDYDGVAEAAYRVADAMISERAK